MLYTLLGKHVFKDLQMVDEEEKRKEKRGKEQEEKQKLLNLVAHIRSLVLN